MEGNRLIDTSEVYQVTVEPYQRPFKQPLRTSYGTWAVRTGAIVTLQSIRSTTAQGEIAPLEWFGSESLESALAFCQSLNGQITGEQIFAIPDRLPCCQFAFEMALAGLQTNHGDCDPPKSQIAALLSTGKITIEPWHPLYHIGHRSFKWKIGVASISEEMQWFDQIYQQLPNGCKLRLDANAGLSLTEATQWLEYLDNYKIEYLEQPLSIDQFGEMKMLSEKYNTLIALDESISTLQQIQECHNKGWKGIYVIKPAIVGSPKRLREFIQQYSIDRVFSSVFETHVGYEAGLKLALELGSDRALGYGIKDWFS